MTALRVSVALLVALATCHARQTPDALEADSNNGRSLLQAPTPWVDAARLATCGEMQPDRLTPPPGAVVAAVFQATGLENYTCIDDRWRVVGSRKDMYYAGTGTYGGYLFAEAHDINNSKFIFTDPDNTTEWGSAVKDNQVTVDYVPAGWPEINRKWWRRPLLRNSGIAANTWVAIKTDVEGGMPPNNQECVSGEDTDLFVPMNNTYTFYACAQQPAFPHTPKCEGDFVGAEDALTTDELYVNWVLPAGNATAGWKCEGNYLVASNAGGTFWLDTTRASTSGSTTLWLSAKVIGEPLCDFMLHTATGPAPATCGPAPGTYTCLQCS